MNTHVGEMAVEESHDPVQARRERDRVRRETDLLDAAEALFAERGFHDARIEEIARRAGYATGTVYRYFPSKERLYGELLYRRLGSYYEIVQREVEGATDARGQVRALVRSKTRFFVSNRDFLLLYCAASQPDGVTSCAHASRHSEVVARFTALLRRVLERAVEEGLLAEGDIERAAAAFMGLTNAVLLQALQAHGQVREKELCAWLTAVVERGLLDGRAVET